MSDTAVAAIAGAILVALLGGLLAYLVNRPRTVVRRRLRRQLRRLVRVMEQPDMVQELHTALLSMLKIGTLRSSPS